MTKAELRVRAKIKELLGAEHQCIQTNVEKDFFVFVVYYDSRGRRCKRFLVADSAPIPKTARQAWKEAERYLDKYEDKFKQ
jgi:hypothetical protein